MPMFGSGPAAPALYKMASPLGHSLAGAIIYKIFYPQEKKINWPILLAIIFISNLTTVRLT